MANNPRTLDAWWDGRLVGQFSETADRLVVDAYSKAEKAVMHTVEQIQQQIERVVRGP